MKFQHANHTPTLPQRAEMRKCSCLYDNAASQVAIPPAYPLTWKSRFTVMLSAFLHRQKSQSCSSSWPPKTLRLNACRPSCWPEAAQPMTAQREVHTAGSLTKLVWMCVCLSALITVTSNQCVSPLCRTSRLCFLTLCSPLL